MKNLFKITLSLSFIVLFMTINSTFAMKQELSDEQKDAISRLTTTAKLIHEAITAIKDGGQETADTVVKNLWTTAFCIMGKRALNNLAPIFNVENFKIANTSPKVGSRFFNKPAIVALINSDKEKNKTILPDLQTFLNQFQNAKDANVKYIPYEDCDKENESMSKID